MITRSVSFFLSIFAVIFSSSLEARTWTQAATGRQIQADLVKVSGTDVVLKLANGTNATVPIDSLSVEDQQFIKESGSASPGSTGNWPAFRGAEGSGVSPDLGLKKEWPEGGPKQLWVFDDAGLGYSSFSIVDGRLYTMGTKGNDVHMVCLDTREGGKVWSESFAEDDQKGYSTGWGHGPRSTPSFSEGKLYGLGPKGTIVCMNAENGSIIWKKHMVDDFGGRMGGWGYSSSPLVDGGKLIVAPGGATRRASWHWTRTLAM